MVKESSEPLLAYEPVVKEKKPKKPKQKINKLHKPLTLEEIAEADYWPEDKEYYLLEEARTPTQPEIKPKETQKPVPKWWRSHLQQVDAVTATPFVPKDPTPPWRKIKKKKLKLFQCQKRYFINIAHTPCNSSMKKRKKHLPIDECDYTPSNPTPPGEEKRFNT